MRFVTRRRDCIAAALSLISLVAVSRPVAGCTISYAAAVASDPAAHLKYATLVVAGHATSVERGPNGDLIAHLTIDNVFKGDAQRLLIVRSGPVHNPCVQSVPPQSEAFYAFLIAAGDGKTFTQVGFVRQSAMPADFASRLGKARAPHDRTR